MKFHITNISDKQISIMIRAEGQGSIGDAARQIRPGEKFFDLAFDELVLLGSGEHDLEFAKREQP